MYEVAIIGVFVATKRPKKQGFKVAVVKDSKTKKSQPARFGRPPRDPDTLRTDRLVLRVHPDLMRHVSDLAQKNGLTRSMLVERALVSFVNLAAGSPVLDSMGRELQAEPEGDQLGTPRSFDEIWSRAVGGPRQPWDAMRRRAARNQEDEQ